MKPNSKSSTRVLAIAACVLAATLIFAPSASLQQQGGDFTLHPTVVPGGGGASATCTKRIEGPIGQASLGTSSAPGFTVESGFWPNSLACPLALSPITQFFTTAGGAGSINVIATGSCGWSASVKTDWITLTSSDTGTGNDVITFEVRENFTGSPRQASINVSGLDQLVVQDAGLGDDCSYSINPQFQAVGKWRLRKDRSDSRGAVRVAGGFNRGLDNDHVTKRRSKQWDSVLLCGGQPRLVGSQWLGDYCRKNVRGEAERALNPRRSMGTQS